MRGNGGTGHAGPATGARLQRTFAPLVVGALLVAAPVAAQELVTTRIALRTVAAVDSVRWLGIDVVEVHRERDGGATVVAVVSARDRALLAARGWFAEEVPRPPLVAALEARRAALGPAAFTVYRDFDDPARGVAAYLRAFAASRANVVVDSVGASVEGRPILAVKLGPSGDGSTRANVLFLATYHAREWAATEMALRLVRFLADSLPARAGGAALLASRDVWVIPVVNPDGYQYTFTTTRLWRKNRSHDPGGSFGVDLNRNHAGFFAFDDGGSSPAPSSETYRGPAAESEPETRAVAAFHRAHPPIIGVSYHTYTGAVLYPWSHAFGIVTGDQPIFEALAGTAVLPAVRDSLPADVLRAYTPGPGWLLYPTNGDYDNWAYHEFRTLAFTPELTAGCCIGGAHYGFEFPDDNALLERVFRDNLPFALAAIEAAGDPVHATGASGVSAYDAAFEAVWPRVVVTAPASAGSLSLDVASGVGVPRSVPLAADTLGVGRYLHRLVSTAPELAGAQAVRVSRLGLAMEVLGRDGGEWAGSPWVGMEVVFDSLVEGRLAYYGDHTMLTSPDIAVAGRRGLRLFFWTRHQGSIYDQALAGVVEASTDRGATWTEVWRIVGAATQWYPVAVPLTVAEGASTVRVRFVAEGMPWYLDALAVGAADTRLFDATVASQGNPLGVSANPVRVAPIVFTWPVEQGTARVQVFSFYGTLVADETLPADPGLHRWDLTTRAGQPVANGAYIVVVTRGDGVRYRRRFFVLRSGS